MWELNLQPSHDNMTLRVLPSIVEFSRSNFFKGAGIAALVALSVIPLHAKKPSLTAIELYSGPAGPAYIQITSFLINRKVELRICGSAPKINKSQYRKLSKVILRSGASIEDGRNGVLTLTQGATSVCVVPSNLKFEKNAALTPAELATRAVLTGTILPGGSDATTTPPPFKPGVKIIFVAAPNVELAEYLRADHSPSISLWQDYLAKYPASSDTENAKQFLVSLFVKDGKNSLDAYRKSLPGPPRSYQDLKNAELRTEQAIEVIPGYAPAIKLKEETHDELTKLINEGRSEMQAYRQALITRTAGYVHLVAARDLANACADIDPHFAPTLSFQAETNKDMNAFETSRDKADSLMASKRYDESFASIEAYTSFAEEVPSIAAIVNATYQFHFDRGERAADAKDWEGAITEFRKASGVRPTKAVAAALKDAEEKLEAAKNAKAADSARAQSQFFEQQGDYVQAYEVLANLPPAQRSLVASDMERLTPEYIESVPKTANEIQKAHDPILGIADEREIQSAYSSLQRAYALSQDPSLKDRADDLGEKLSKYDLAQAKQYMDKPLGSGAGLGWCYLEKALEYKASNLDAVRDERTKAEFAYQMRSWLSIKVNFRDQTSRRLSAGFANQLADAIATGLEASGFSGKVIRPGENPAFDPNFHLVGDVIEHYDAKVVTSKPKDSHYRASEQEIPNPKWNKTNREYETAREELRTLQQSLSGIDARGKKKEIAEENDKISAAEKKVNGVHARLDSIPRNIPKDVIKPYTYTDKTVDVSAIVQLQFRITDLFGNQVVDTVPLKKEKERKYQILENVSPEDMDGVKAQGTEPDENQLLTDDENDARDALVKAVIESTAKLPEIVFKRGNKQEEEDNPEAAAESYILYLNSTPTSQNPERRRAENFLLENYLIRWPDSTPSP